MMEQIVFSAFYWPETMRARSIPDRELYFCAGIVSVP